LTNKPNDDIIITEKRKEVIKMVLSKVGKGKNVKYYIYDILGRREITKAQYYKLSKILENERVIFAKQLQRNIDKR
jgi:rRNA maturation protein Rpf1